MTHPDLLQDEDLATERETLREPSKAWRNWWIYGCSFFCLREAKFTKSGVPYPGTKIFPTRKEAEDWARDEMGKHVGEDGIGFPPREYLGAFPEGERP